MGLFSRRKEKEKLEQKVRDYFSLMNAYTPTYTTFEGGVYEMELTRAAIHSFANHCSKLKPEVRGSGNKSLERILQNQPNKLMDTKKYLYRLATVLAVDNTAFIAPLENNYGDVVGFYPLLTSKCQIVDYSGKKYLRYQFDTGVYGAIELDKAGRLTQFQYKDEIFGETNRCMRPTMEMMNANNQSIIEGVKNSASVRFIAKLAQSLKPSDIDAERKRFRESNLSVENNGGVMMFDTKYEDIKQVAYNQFTVNAGQIKQIKENVFNYFGTNEAILQNRFTSEEWAAYYEGKIEPFAIEASLVHTSMVFSDREIAFGNDIIFTANRLQYMSNIEKLNTVTQLFDRGFITHNQGRDIFNMAPIEGGDKLYIRREYVERDRLNDTLKNDSKTEDIEDQGGGNNAENE